MSVDNSFAELLASERFKEVVDKVKRYTLVWKTVSGQNAFMQLANDVATAVQQVKSIENENEEYLENLAVDLVKKEMALPDEAFQFDVELLSGMGQIDTSKMRGQSDEEPDEEEIMKAFGDEMLKIWRTILNHLWMPWISLTWKRQKEDSLTHLFKERLRKVIICLTWFVMNWTV